MYHGGGRVARDGTIWTGGVGVREAGFECVAESLSLLNKKKREVKEEGRVEEQEEAWMLSRKRLAYRGLSEHFRYHRPSDCSVLALDHERRPQIGFRNWKKVGWRDGSAVL